MYLQVNTIFFSFNISDSREEAKLSTAQIHYASMVIKVR